MTGAPAAVLLPDTASVRDLTRSVRAGTTIVVHRPDEVPGADAVTALTAALSHPGVASASPVPLSTGTPSSRTYAAHPALPAPPTLALPARSLCAFGADALGSMPAGVPGADPDAPVGDHLVPLAEHLTRHGWRHVAAPGVAAAWDPADTSGLTPDAGWTETFVRSQVGPANVGLEAHVSWASAALDGARVVIDGVCLTDQPFTGTQHLVVEVARWMATVRPDWPVAIAVRRSQVDGVRRRLGDAGVSVVDRGSEVDADVVYRPYQMLFARELPFTVGTGRRRLVGQLDMIGFANASYHPSDRLAFFARNLQRHMMRTFDGVTFISEFGRDSALAECPDLDLRRMHVVSCGADPVPPDGTFGPAPTGLDRERGFVVSLSSTFWHKNRAHAIATFTSLVHDHGYDGSLVIAGPEPYFGRSTAAEDALLDALEPEVRSRVHRIGHVDDRVKWWLLAEADVALYPSVVEGFGLVPFEAATVGTPCLANAATAPGELLAGTGALVASWDPAVWATHAAGLIADPVRSQAVTDEVVEVMHRHTWRRCAERTWAAIDHALASPRRDAAGEDGPLLTHVAGARTARVPAAGVRFDMARGLPAVKRRAIAAVRSAKGRR